MSAEYYYENDLNMLYNEAVGNKTNGGKHHTKMMEAHANIEAHINNLEHWRDTALQLSKNCGYAQSRIDALEADYAISNRELLIKQVEINRLTAENASLRELVKNLQMSETHQRRVQAVKHMLEQTAFIRKCFSLDVFRSYPRLRDEALRILDGGLDNEEEK